MGAWTTADLGREHNDAGLDQQKRRAVILSDTRVFRELLRVSLGNSGEVEVVSTSGAADAEEQIRGLRPAIILLDAALSGGLTVPQFAKSIIPNVIIIVFAASNNDRDFLEWAETGISGYLDQYDSLDEVRATIARAARGELVCSPLRTALLLGRVAILSAHRAAGGSFDVLTARENEVMALLAEGLPNKLIARRMGVTEATVKNHVHNILEKTGAHTRGEAAAKYRAGRRVAGRSTSAHRPNQTSDESDARELPNRLRLASVVGNDTAKRIKERPTVP
jgi:two-component system, NarL family, nitrate/nitrite response regulator NarL